MKIKIETEKKKKEKMIETNQIKNMKRVKILILLSK